TASRSPAVVMNVTGHATIMSYPRVTALAPLSTCHRIGGMATAPIRVALTCAFISAAAPAARAQRPPPAIRELDHAAWTIRDGAPTSIQALAQSADGMLWLGT